MADGKTIVIIGAGLAGDTAAGELRAIGWAGQIVMIGDEPERPYDRPPLSKGVLLDSAEEAKAYLRPAAWYDEQGIELRLGDPCVAIDPDGHFVSLGSGERIAFAKLLIATGARARRLPSIETGAFPVHTLRSLADARSLRAGLQAGASVVVIGGGVIGLEVAASAVQSGCVVTVIEGLDRIMARCVSPRVSEYLLDYHRSKGARVLCGARLAAVQDKAGSVLLEDETVIGADLVIVGIGASPDAALAEAAGLRVEDGIVVDRATRTSHPDIHAAGDVTRFESHDGYARAEHWRHAIDQATTAAHVMAGRDALYAEQPWLWSDQYELNIQVTGAAQGDSEALRGSAADNAFILFHLREGRLVGATSVNQARHKRAVAALVATGGSIDPALLADPSVDLKKLAATIVGSS